MSRRAALIARFCGGLLLAAAPFAGWAQDKSADSLIGRRITVRIVAYDDPARPLYDWRSGEFVIGPGVELELGPDRRDKTPKSIAAIDIDISAARIEGRYLRRSPGRFLQAAFNGYVIDFQGRCGVFAGARVDRKATNIALTDSHISVREGRLYINFSGLRYGPGSRFAVKVTAAPCRLF